MKKTDKEKESNRASFKNLTSILESIPASGTVPEISEEEINAILGNDDVSAAAEITENEVEEKPQSEIVKPNSQKSKAENNNTRLQVKSKECLEGVEKQDGFGSWLLKAKQTPSIPVDRKYLIHYDIVTIKPIVSLSKATGVAVNRILATILNDWLNEHGNEVKQEVKRRLTIELNDI